MAIPTPIPLATIPTGPGMKDVTTVAKHIKRLLEINVNIFKTIIQQLALPDEHIANLSGTDINFVQQVRRELRND
jgi:hypothetical protein